MTAITEADRAPHEPFTVQPGIRVVPLRTPTLPPATHTNCVVLGDDRVILVDPASPYSEEQERLHDWISDAGVTVVAVWLTHHHADHVGGANAAREAFGAPVCAHPATGKRLHGHVAIDIELFEGDRPSDVHEVDLGLEVVALHTPGHARGHLAFRDEATRAVVAGDLVAGQGTIVIDPPEGDMADYLSTLGRLISEGCGTLIPSHGPAIEAGEEKLLQYIAHRQMREEQLIEALRRKPGRPIELVPALYPEIPSFFHPLASRQLLAHLLKLEAEGVVTRPDGSTGVPGAPIYLSADMAGWTAALPVFALPVMETAGATPRFVYDVSAVQARERIEAVRAAFEGEVALLYATKANGHQGLLRAMQPTLDGADVTSRGALHAAMDAGFAPHAIQFTSPGKSRADLDDALRAGACVVLGCVDEARDVAAAAEAQAMPLDAVPALVRINPSERIHAFRSPAGGVASPFGIPEEEIEQALPAIRAMGLAPRGLHVHRGSQCTSATAFARHVTSTLDLADRLVRAHGLPPHVNLGGGLGVATQGAPELPLSSLGRRCARALRAFRAEHPHATFALEPGRYLVGEAGTLHVRVLRRRVVRGVTFLVLDGGIDVFLFAGERMRHGPPPPIRNASRPDAEPERVTLVGPACTSEDTLVSDLLLPRAEPGDVLVIGHAGAYAAGASVAGFLGRDRALEVLA